MGTASAAEPRARDLGIPFPGTPGPLNAITDVAGVEVGYTTLIAGDGKLVVGKGPVRTGVTAVLPRGSIQRRGPTSPGGSAAVSVSLAPSGSATAGAGSGRSWSVAMV